MKNLVIYPALILLIALRVSPVKKTRIFLAGDSTMSIKEVKAYPETGWGMPFVNFWDTTIQIVNKARNGRSSKSFIAEGIWKSITDEVKEGDYVFIQFGHNDESKDKGDRYSTPDEFKANLLKYVNDTRSLKGIPVLITPVARRKFDEQGKIRETHGEYADLVRQVAEANSVLLVDLDKKSMELLQKLGPVNSTYLYNYLEAGEHPNYPEGKQDDTHFNELGARKMAELVLAEIRTLIPDLAAHIVVKKS
jgi:lysophospholipase L1-like esterase